MRNLFKLLAVMQEKNIGYCFQCQGKNSYYNISFKCPKGKSMDVSSKDIKVIEGFTMTVWGHILPKFDNDSLKPLFIPPNCTASGTIVHNVPGNAVIKIPMPPGIPRPF